MRGELLKGSLDLILLAILAGGPKHGYAVVADLRQRSDGAFDLPEGTIYPALHRLEAAGLLTSSWSTESGRRRRVYTLSRRGRAALGARRAEWHDFTGAVAAVIS